MTARRPTAATGHADAVACGIAESPAWKRAFGIALLWIAGIVLSVAGSAALILWGMK